MSDSITIQVEGLDEITKALSDVRLRQAVETGMRGAAEIVREPLATYPPASAANRSPGVNGYSWYERGFGTRTVTGRAYPTSQALGRSWTTDVVTRGKTIAGVIGTTVSYGPFVHGEKQAGFHRARGWKRTQQVVRETERKVAVFLERVIANVLSRLTG